MYANISSPSQKGVWLADALLDTSSLPQLWSCVEVSFGIISSCLPSLTALFHLLLGKRLSSFGQNSGYSSRSRDGSIRTAEFNRIADMMDGKRRSYGLELVGIRHSTNDLSSLDESWGPGTILVTRQVHQVTEKKIDQIPEID